LKKEELTFVFDRKIETLGIVKGKQDTHNTNCTGHSDPTYWLNINITNLDKQTVV
jgi:hypothetical protein